MTAKPLKLVEPAPSCATCKFSRGTDRAQLDCRRFPQTIAKHRGEFCGEFQQRSEA